jgi:hypothetical protein
MRTLLIALASLLVVGGRTSAETIPPFNLHQRTASAEWIVHGRLDAKGRLIVDATLKGKATAKQVALTNGKAVFASLKALEERATSIEVVVYLRQSGGRWETEHGDNGAVGFLNNGVCLVRQDEHVLRPGAAMGRDPTLSREAFLKDARAAVAAFERRKALLALPASADRMGKIAELWCEMSSEGRGNHLHALTRSLRPLRPVEQRALLARLKSSDAAARPLLLELTGSLATGTTAFDAVAEQLDRRQPGAVRRAAILSLADLDPYRAQARLIPLLRVDEPELQSALETLGGTDGRCPNPAVLGPLRKLTEAVRRLHRDDREALVGESEALAAVLWHYGHPTFLPLLVEWTLSDNHVTAEFVGCRLQQWTGLSPRANPSRWARWWKGAKPLLEADYDLRAAAGRRKWYRAYRAGGVASRLWLLRLWPLDPAPDEAALVREAGCEGGDVAKAVLAELWGLGRLSGVTKGDLLGKFLTVRLEEVPGLPIARSRELRIVGEKSFPFPPTAWVDWRAAIVIGDDREPKLEGSYSSSSLGNDPGDQTFGTMGGGSYPGTPQARALLELRETSSAGGIAWRRTWTLKPIRLREAK